MPTDRSPHLPLIALLGQAHDAMETAFNARLSASPFPDLSLAHSRNVLRHVGSDDCRRARELVERAGISKQALSLQIAHLEQAGYLTSEVDPDDGRARRLELTPKGEAAQRVVIGIMRDLDAEWRERWGEDWERVRTLLFGVMNHGARA